MLVPTKYAEDTVHWHVLFNENGNRISFTDFRVRKIVKDFDLLKHLTLSGVETARHIVGWCEQVRNYAGKPCLLARSSAMLLVRSITNGHG